MLDRSLVRLVRDDRLRFALTIAFSLAAGLLTIAQAWLLSGIVDAVFLRGATLSVETASLALLLVVMLSRAAVQMVSQVAASEIAIRVKINLRQRLVAHLVALGPAYTGGERTGELTAAATEGIEALDPYFSQYLPQLVIAALVPLAVLVVVLPLDPLSGIILLVTAPLIPVFMILIGNAAEGLTRRQFNLLSRLSAHFLDTLQGLATLKALNQSRGQDAAIRRAGNQYARATLKVLRVAFLSALVLEIVATISTALVAVQVGLRVLYAQMDFRPALFILILAPEFYWPLRMLGLRFHSAASGASAARRVFQILNTTPEIRVTSIAGTSGISSAGTRVISSGARNQPEPPPGGRFLAPFEMTSSAPSWSTLSFLDVRYAYGDRAALNGVSFDLRRAQTVALFGPTGAGKSTILSLLLRFIRPTSGEIRVDGFSLESIPPDVWRAGIAWVPQSPHLLHDTIAANIRLGRPDANDQEVRSAAESAQLDEFIEALPERYDTMIGEEGARLSGGEAQRLALARAFLRDAPLLLLDEPTSNVDADTEARLVEATRRLMAGRTVLVIAHRLSTIHAADRVVVLKEGRVVEQGPHDELLASGGLYAELAGPSVEEGA